MTKQIALILFFTHSFFCFSQENYVQNPVQNFDYLWSTFNERYSNFEVKNIDWNSTYKIYRPLITDSTTNNQLFKVCNQMLATLKDGHSNLIQKDKNGNTIKESDDGSLSSFINTFPHDKNNEFGFFELINTTDKTLKKNQFTNFVASKKEVLTFASNENIGYLRIQYMFNLSLREFKKRIDQAILSFKNKKGIILDLRFNPGGHNKISCMIANRFTDKKRIGHYLRRRIPKTNTFTTSKACYLKPKGKQPFSKPILILTSDFTASAAETFVLAMKQIPHVTIVGNRTNGVFSEMYDFKLPNNWDVSLSHQQQLSPQLKNYEGIGIPPDIKIINTVNDIKQQADSVLLKAIEILNQL